MTRQTINISEISRLTGLDRATIGKHLDHIQPMNANSGRQGSKEYYLDEVLSVLIRSFKAKFEDGAKARKELADAEKAEIQVARLRGDLAPTSQMRTSAADLVKSLFQKCVMLAPRLLSDAVTGNADRNEVEIAIRTHYAGIFDELRSLPNNFLNITDAEPPTD